MKKILLDEQKKLILKIMDYIHSVCMDNNIKYSLAGGSLIGAIRENGFIPWDDDLDIMLVRSEYNKLIRILEDINHPEFILLNNQYENYKYAFSKLCLKTTFQKSPLRENKNMGVFVDIFPIDGLPNDAKRRKEFIDEIIQQRNSVQFANVTSYFGAKTYTKMIVKILAYFPKYLKSKRKGSMQTQSLNLNSTLQSYKIEDVQECANMLSPYFPDKEIYSSAIFKKYENILFEDRKYMIISNYDSYLKKVFGDYMTPPSESERINHSFYRWYWRS